MPKSGSKTEAAFEKASQNLWGGLILQSAAAACGVQPNNANERDRPSGFEARGTVFVGVDLRRVIGGVRLLMLGKYFSATKQVLSDSWR